MSNFSFIFTSKKKGWVFFEIILQKQSQSIVLTARFQYKDIVGTEDLTNKIKSLITQYILRGTKLLILGIISICTFLVLLNSINCQVSHCFSIAVLCPLRWC